MSKLYTKNTIRIAAQVGFDTGKQYHEDEAEGTRVLEAQVQDLINSDGLSQSNTPTWAIKKGRFRR